MSALHTATATQSPKKILLVDDLRDNLVVLEKILSPLHVELVSVENGESALTEIIIHDFTVVILDVMMPGMSGYELVEQLRKNPKAKDTPLIFITGSQPDDREIAKGYELGATDYIVKPFAPAVLTTKVEKILEIDCRLRELEQQRLALEKSESERIKELEISQKRLHQSEKNAIAMMKDAIQAKIQAEESAARYRMLFENMPSGFSLHEMIYDENGRAIDYNFLQVNPAFEILTGLKREDLIGKTVKEALPGTESHWIDLYADVVKTGKPALYENYAKELGKYFSVRAFRPVPGRFAVLFSDVTEIRQTENQLKLNQFAVEHLKDAVYWNGLDGKFSYVNEAACKELGYSREELLQMYLWEIDREVTAESWARCMEEFSLQGHSVMERVHQRKDSSRFPVEINANYVDFMGEKLICAFAQNITERIAVRENLESSQRLLRSIIDSIPIRIFWKDKQATYLGGNTAFARDAGFDHPDQLIGKADFDFPWKQGKIEQYREDDLKVIESGIPQLDYEERRLARDGTDHWIKTNKIPLTNTNGKIIGVLGTYEDITERKQMQEAIEKRILALTLPLEDTKEITFDALFNLQEIQKIQDEFAAATKVASIIIHSDGSPITEPSNLTGMCNCIQKGKGIACSSCVLFDPGFAEIHPGDPEAQCNLNNGLWSARAKISVGGKHIANWLIGQVRDESQSADHPETLALETGNDPKAFAEALSQIPVMSGEQFRHVAEALNSMANQLSNSAYQNIQQARFIADEKRRTQELRRLSTAIEQSPEVIVITDTQGVIEYANPAFERSTGYSCAEVIGQKPSVLKSGNHPQEFYDGLWKTVSAGETWQGRIINKRKDGSLFTEEAVISPVKSPDGTITNYVSVKRDISEELVREEQMQQAQKMEAVGQLAGGIAHDFNNIIQAVMGFSDLLLLTLDESDSPSRDNVAEIQKAAEHAADLTRQLLAFSRKQRVQFKKINLNDLVGHSLNLITSILGETNEVKTDLSPDILPVNADAGQLERIILNMAINARDAMPQGGMVTVKTENVKLSEQDTHSIPNSRPGDFVCLSLSDTGVGIPQDIIGRIFEPFFTTKRPGKGTGLGLAALYGIIQKHMGWINVHSKPGQGAAFNIYIPAVLEEPDASAIPQQKEASLSLTGKGHRILVVEDSEAVRKLSVNALTEAGYKVISAKSAEEAEPIFVKEQGNFDLLFSDVILPKKNGADLAVSLRKSKPDLQVLLCSGYSGNRIEEAGAQLKNSYFLEKPFSMIRLLEKVQQILAPEH